MTQRTISKQVSLSGKGIHSGRDARLIFRPAEADQGIVFIRTDMSPRKSIPVSDFQPAPQERCTAISRDGALVHTIEHLMAALYALSIDNIIIETDSAELPGLDGSGLGFFDALKAAGSSEQSSPARVIKIKEPLWCEKKDAFLGIFPSEILKISYFFESRSPVLGRQAMTLDATPEAVIKEILPARTFCLKEEAEMLLKLGFGKGANTDNTLVLDKDGPVKNAFRYPDEPVRHKILDLVGDLYLAGRVQGRVIAIRSGHDLNMELVQKVRKQV